MLSEYSLISREFVDLPTGRLESSFKISKKMKFSLIGENGIGKTSLFNYIKKNHFNTNYSCSFLDQKRLDPLANLTVEEVFNLLEEELDTNQTEKEELINYFDFNDCIRNKVKLLSGGENQILKIIICFFLKRDLYLLDEPFLNLSVKNKERLKEYLMNSNKTILIIDHHIDLLKTCTDKIFEMKKNKDQLMIQEYHCG